LIDRGPRPLTPEEVQRWDVFVARVGGIVRQLGIPLTPGGYGEKAAAIAMVVFRAYYQEKRESGGSLPAEPGKVIPISAGKRGRKRRRPPVLDKGGGS